MEFTFVSLPILSTTSTVSSTSQPTIYNITSHHLATTNSNLPSPTNPAIITTTPSLGSTSDNFNPALLAPPALPLGAKIALGVGIPITVTCLVSFYLFLRWRDKREEEGTGPGGGETSLREVGRGGEETVMRTRGLW
jgi:hypothetical protein